MKRLLLALVFSVASCSVASAQSKPVDFSLGWSYDYAAQGNGYANLNGWYGTLTYEAWKQVGITVQHQDFWGAFQNSGVNQHAWLGGATVKLRKGSPKFSPFVQPLGGDTRSSSSGSIQHEPTFQLGAGADITLKKNLSLELIPAEYNLSHGNNQVLNSYQAGAGFQYTFGK